MKHIRVRKYKFRLEHRSWMGHLLRFSVASVRVVHKSEVCTLSAIPKFVFSVITVSSFGLADGFTFMIGSHLIPCFLPEIKANFGSWNFHYTFEKPSHLGCRTYPLR